MFLAILKRAVSVVNRLCLWSLLPTLIGVIIILWQTFVGTNETILVWGWLLSWVWLPPLVLPVILYLVLTAVRGLDLLSTEPAVAEVISVKRTGVFINSVPQLAVKMRVKGRNVITECRVLDFVGPAVGDVYNIKISRLNPAVAKMVNPAGAEVAYS
jgi:hypothetical protein